MRSIVKKLRILECVGLRLEALSSGRGLPDNVSKRIKDEYQAVLWACNELRNYNFFEVITIIGNLNSVDS